jgi:hypothetical protein
MNCMDDTINGAMFSPLSIATTVIGTIAAKVRTIVDEQVPDGHEDESGFHYGAPTFKN